MPSGRRDPFGSPKSHIPAPRTAKPTHRAPVAAPAAAPAPLPDHSEGRRRGAAATSVQSGTQVGQRLARGVRCVPGGERKRAGAGGGGGSGNCHHPHPLAWPGSRRQARHSARCEAGSQLWRPRPLTGCTYRTSRGAGSSLPQHSRADSAKGDRRGARG